MAIKLPEIPIIEDIYDFDTITLREATEKVQLTLQKVDNIEQKEQVQILWLKKAKRYLELALQEIEERKAIENFGNYCVSNNDSILMSNVEDTSGVSDSSVKKMETQNSNSAQSNKLQNQKNAFGNIDEWIKLHQQISQQSNHSQQNQQEKKSTSNQQKHYSVPYQIKESEEEDNENYQSSHQLHHNKYNNVDQKKIDSQIKVQDDEEDEDQQENQYEFDEEDNLHSASVMKKQQLANEKYQKNFQQVNNDFCNNSIISGKSGGSHSSSQLKYMAHHKRLKTKSKQEEMQEFIRQTLEKTKITQSSYVGGSSGYTQQYFHKTSTQGEDSSDGAEIQMKKKKTKSASSAQVTATSLPKRSSISEKVPASNEYAGVQSKIKQDLEQQRLKKLETPYFTTGKASYPKYIPPKQKKVDPDEEKKNRTKNFLKKSQPSVSLPPINQKKSSTKSGSADNSSVNGSERENKKNSAFVSRAASVTTSASTDNLSEKISGQTIDLNNIGSDDHSHDHNKHYKKPFSDKSISNDFSQNQLQGEIIQEEINENNNESDPESHQKIIPGQPRKITKGELFRIKSTRSATSEKSNNSQMGESMTPSKFDFSENPQQFIEEDIVNQETNNQQLRDKLIKTKSRSSLHSLKNTVGVEDPLQTKHSNAYKIDQEPFNQMESQKSNLNIRQNSDESIHINNDKEENINKINNNNQEKQKQNINPIIPSIIPPEKNGMLSIKNILNQDDNSSNNILTRREADENPTDSEDDLNEEERLLLYNKKGSDDNIQIKNEDEQKEQQISDGESQDGQLEDQEKELLQNSNSNLNRKESIKQLSSKDIQQKQSIKQQYETKTSSKNEIHFQEYKDEKEEEEDYQGEDQLDEDEQLLVSNTKEKDYELIEKYEKDSKQIVINAKKILENKGINDQLKNRMEKLLSNFQQNEREVQEIEQSYKESEELNKRHAEEVKKNKNQIFGVPSKKKPESPFTGVSNKVASKKENEFNKGTNTQDPKSKKDTKLQPSDSGAQQKSKEDRTGNDITNNTEKKQNQLKGSASALSKDKKLKSKEEIELETLQQEQDQFVKEQKQVMKKKATATAAPKPPSMTSKLLMKMMKEISDDSLIDYTQTIPTFFHLFSGYYNQIWSQNNPMMGGNVGSSININIAGGGGVNFCLIDAMRDIYSLFQQHVEKVDNADKGLLRYKQVVTPLEVLPSEVYYVNDPQKVIVYQNRVDIDIKKFIERQIIFTQRMNGENFAGHLLPHEEFYYRVVKSKPEVYDIISRSFMRKKDWFELPHGLQLRTSWNLLWTWSKPQIDFNKLLLFQKVNHFPFNKNLVRKDLLKKNFERVTKLGQKAAQAFNILPLTFVLPKEYCNFSERFYEEMLREGENNIWIMKPVGKSQGRGISLVNDIAQVVYAEPVVVQKYMKDPLLLDGYKFDMRIYALITHMKPLEAFVYKEGFARLSTEKYQLNAQTIKNNQIHLTNFSIQKHHYDPASNNNFIGGTKISLKMLQEKFRQKGIDWDKIWIQVQEIIVKSVLACQADIPNNPNCFEIFGYDIIIDSSLKCCLLEINSSPSLARDFIIDDLVKQQMVDDAIDLVAPVQFDRLRLLEVLDRRIREEQGNKSNINTTNNSKLQLNRDLNYILRGQKLRQYGETPSYLGQWQKVAPTEMSDKYLKIIQSYKLPSVRQNTANAANNNNTID